MNRIWGRWEVLDLGKTSDGNSFKVKKLTILPRMSISHQYHNFRAETWVIVEGKAQVIQNGKSFVVGPGDVFTINIKDSHKVLNICEDTNLVAIEVQQGSITEEDDIVRI